MNKLLAIIIGIAIFGFCNYVLSQDVWTSPTEIIECEIYLDEDVVTIEDNPCWAACCEYLSNAFFFDWFDQCNFTTYAVNRAFVVNGSCEPPSGDCCLGSYCSCCEVYYYNVHELMEADEAGFTQGGCINGKMTSYEIYEDFCLSSDENMIYTIFDIHAVVINGYIEYIEDASVIYLTFMDPNFYNYVTWPYSYFCSTTEEYGDWRYYWHVYSFVPTDGFMDVTATEDIRSFNAVAEVTCVDLSFEICGDASPNENASVYISDNSLGPAVLIDDLIQEPNLCEVITWYDTYRI